MGWSTRPLSPGRPSGWPRCAPGWPASHSRSWMGCAEHRALADELARRSITLVRNDAGLLPIRLASDARVAVVMSRPTDLTPADSSSFVTPNLAPSVRRRQPATDEFVTANPATDDEIRGLRAQLAGYDLIVVGTRAAHTQEDQAKLANALLELGPPTVTVALRTPWDLAAYPSATTHVCSYGALPPTSEVLAAALWGEVPFRGRLPVSIAGMYPRGHGLVS